MHERTEVSKSARVPVGTKATEAKLSEVLLHRDWHIEVEQSRLHDGADNIEELAF
jgi:hypothetical protein